MVSISIIIPVYNCEKYIENCLNSLLKQTFMNWEAVCIDDGSRDNSLQILKSFANRDNRIKVLHTENRGVSSARNTGIENSVGERLMFLDSDDMLESDALQELCNYIREYDYDVVCWALRTNSQKPLYFPLSSEKTAARDGDEKTLYDLRLRAFTGWSVGGKKDYSMHYAVTKLIKKSLITSNGLLFHTDIRYHEDTLFCNQVLQCASSVLAVNRFFYVRTLHTKSASVSFCGAITDSNVRCLELFKEFIDTYYKGDPLYNMAYVKFQLTWLIQCLQLDCMNKEACYNKKERIKKIGELLDIQLFQPKDCFWGLKIPQRVFFAMVRLKMKRSIYFCFKYGIVK